MFRLSGILGLFLATMIVLGGSAGDAPAAGRWYTGDCDVFGPGGPSPVPAGGVRNDLPSFWSVRTYMAAFCSQGTMILYFGEYMPISARDGWNIGYGQRRGSNVPIFSNQRHVNQVGPKDWIQSSNFALRPLGADVYAFFRVQYCHKPLFGSSECSPWTAPLTVHLGQRELTAY